MNKKQNLAKIKSPSLSLLTVTIIASLGGLLFGFDLGVTNGSLIFMGLPGQLNLTPMDEGLVTGSLILGAVFGSLVAGSLADKYGRRTCIIFMAAILFIFRFGCVLAINTEMMIAFRFILGLAVGGISVVVPMYLAEVSASEDRSKVISIYSMMLVGGQFITFAVNAILGNLFGYMDDIWRYMIAIAFIPALTLWLGMLKLPESPRWLIIKGKQEQALAVLNTIRIPNLAKREFAEIKDLVNSEATMQKASFQEFVKTPWIRRILLFGIAVAIIQQITGVNAINYYGTQILYDSGFDLNTALIANVGNGLIAILAVAMGMKGLNKTGRRNIFLLGLAVTTFAEIGISILSVTSANQDYYGYAVFALVLVFMAFQQGCSVLVTWVLMSELFPLRLRGIGIGTMSFVLWVANLAVGVSFPSIIANFGTASTFLGFAFCGVISFLIVWKYCPETKDRTLEELEYCFKNYKQFDLRKVDNLKFNLDRHK